MFDRYRDAIAQIESAGSGDYSAIGPTHPRLGRALGRYQVMEANIGPWSREALGREVSPDEFVNNPQIQDAIFDHKFGGYVNQFGPEGAAQAWFAGPGGVGKMTRQDSLGTSVGQYAEKFRNALGQTVSTQGATDMQQQQKPQGILGMFDDDQIDKPSKLEIIGNALMGMSAFPTRGMQAQMKSHQDRMAEYRGNKKTAKQQNKAAAWLRNSGMGQLADAVENGVMSGREAMAMAMQQPKDDRTALMKNAEWIMGQNPDMSFDEALQAARSGQTINLGGQGPQVGTIPQGYQLAQDKETGAYRMEPIPGGPADREIATEQQQQAAAVASNQETKAREQDVALENIAAIKETLNSGGMMDLPETGIVGDRLARSGLNQEAVNVKNRLASLQGLIGFDRLQRMREESPTGGALGAISERELELLSAQLGTLNQSSDRDTLMSTLDRIERIYSGILEKAKAYPNADQYGFTGPAPSGRSNRLRFNPETGDFE